MKFLGTTLLAAVIFVMGIGLGGCPPPEEPTAPPPNGDPVDPPERPQQPGEPQYDP